MNIQTLPFGHNDGPREHWCAKVQILGSPKQNWSLTFQAETVETFLRQHMATTNWSEPNDESGETNITFSYQFPSGWVHTKASGTARLAPSPGLSFDLLSYGMVYDLLEAIIGTSQDTEVVVIFSEFRAIIFKAGMTRDQGIHYLSETVNIELGRVFFPIEWGSEDQL